MPSDKTKLVFWLPILFLLAINIMVARLYPAVPMPRISTDQPIHLQEVVPQGSDTLNGEAVLERADAIALLDLTEQRRMADATESLSENSRAQVTTAHWGLFFNMIAVGIIIAVLYWNREAAKVAAAKVAIDGLRAWLCVDKVDIQCARTSGRDTYQIYIYLLNTGRSPAFAVRPYCGWRSLVQAEPASRDEIALTAREAINAIPHGSQSRLLVAEIQKSALQDICGTPNRAFIRARVEYRTMGGADRITDCGIYIHHAGAFEGLDFNAGVEMQAYGMGDMDLT